MTMKKIVLLLCICSLFCITGCQNKDYQRDTNPGEVITISLDELENMMEENQTFVVMLTQTMCGYCHQFHELLKEYQEDHHFVIYEVVLDEEQRSAQENLAIIKPHFPNFSTTPGIFYVEEGEVEAQLTGDISTGIQEEMLEEWVLKHQLDRVSE